MANKRCSCVLPRSTYLMPYLIESRYYETNRVLRFMSVWLPCNNGEFVVSRTAVHLFSYKTRSAAIVRLLSVCGTHKKLAI